MPGQRVQRGVEAAAAAARSSGSARPDAGGARHSGLRGAGRATARLGERFDRPGSRLGRPAGSSKSAVVTASGTIQPSSPGCASIMRSSRWPRGRTGGKRVRQVVVEILAGRRPSAARCAPMRGTSGPPDVGHGPLVGAYAHHRRVQHMPGPGSPWLRPSGRGRGSGPGRSRPTRTAGWTATRCGAAAGAASWRTRPPGPRPADGPAASAVPCRAGRAPRARRPGRPERRRSSTSWRARQYRSGPDRSPSRRNEVRAASGAGRARGRGRDR